MKIIIVNSFDTFEYRVLLLKKVMKELGHEVMVFGSDFRHIEKTRRVSEDPEITLLPVRAYQKNISLDRILSHMQFARDVFRRIKEIPCDLLYLVVPPNSQATLAAKYKKLYPKAKVIMDLIDLWPESFPSSHTQQFPFTLWGNLRNRSLKNADLIITECNLYREKLDRFLQGRSVETLYWARQEENSKVEKEAPSEIVEESLVGAEGEASVGAESEANMKITNKAPADRWVLGYLGSINHIIDLQEIAKTIQFFRKDKPVELQIVGGGESLEEMIAVAEGAGAKVISHGKIYDSLKKQEIFSACHYGINMMKDTVVVGLSMKSIEYMELGLPILNNLSGDTRQFVAEKRMGYNTDALDYHYEEAFGQNARTFFEENCSYEAFQSKVVRILKELLG